MACKLPNLFRQLYINGRGFSSTSYCTVNNARTSSNAVPSFLKLPNSTLPSIYEPNLTFSPRSIDFDFTIPPPGISRISIIDAPISINRNIEEPQKVIHNKEDIIPDKEIDLPTRQNVIEKHAVRMIIIRKHKMRVHKLRKLRKKMKFVWRKYRLRRKNRKEKIFKKMIFQQIHQAERFDAKKYVDSRIRLLVKEPLPTRWRGEVLPKEMILQFLKEHRQKKEAKKNRKRLTL